MVIHQGDIYWVDLGDPNGSEPGDRRPFVVIQNDLFNSTRIATVVMVALTTNLDRAKFSGNVRLEKGEGGLPKPSVVNVTQLATVDKSYLSDYCGSLSKARVEQIIRGIRLVLHPTDVLD
jgi:mRNA interferase MazF